MFFKKFSSSIISNESFTKYIIVIFSCFFCRCNYKRIITHKEENNVFKKIQFLVYPMDGM